MRCRHGSKVLRSSHIIGRSGWGRYSLKPSNLSNFNLKNYFSNFFSSMAFPKVVNFLIWFQITKKQHKIRCYTIQKILHLNNSHRYGAMYCLNCHASPLRSIFAIGRGARHNNYFDLWLQAAGIQTYGQWREHFWLGNALWWWGWNGKRPDFKRSQSVFSHYFFPWNQRGQPFSNSETVDLPVFFKTPVSLTEGCFSSSLSLVIVVQSKLEEGTDPLSFFSPLSRISPKLSLLWQKREQRALVGFFPKIMGPPSEFVPSLNLRSETLSLILESLAKTITWALSSPVSSILQKTTLSPDLCVGECNPLWNQMLQTLLLGFCEKCWSTIKSLCRDFHTMMHLKGNRTHKYY